MRNLKDWLIFRPWQRHSLVLTIGGLVYIAHGITLFTLGELSATRENSLVVALNMFTLPQWGLQFIGAGILAVLSSRWPTFSDSWGYAILTSLAGAWATIYLWGYFVVRNSTALSVTNGLTWALTAFMWWAISGLSNPERRMRDRRWSVRRSADRRGVHHGPD